MPTDPWSVLGLLILSAAVTLATRWLAGVLQRPGQKPARSAGAFVADLVWMVLVFVAGLIASRYIERIECSRLAGYCAVAGYIVFGLGAFILSLVRALLYQRSREQRVAGQGMDREQLLAIGLHNLTYLLFALDIYLLLSLLLHATADPLLFIPLSLGALLPDLDSQTSVLGRLLPFISRRLKAHLGHLGAWHSLPAAGLLALIASPLVLVTSMAAWTLIVLGFVAHLILDLLHPQGVMLFWPATRSRYRVFGGPVGPPGGSAERKLAFALAVVAAALLFAVDLGPPPVPEVPVLSYAQTVERYYSLRGRNLVFASVQGTWQATGRRMSGRFEILNASGESFTMLDRYTRQVFTAGRNAEDNLYLNGIRLQPGDPAQIKAVELKLENQPLAEALPILYEMQREPGLQHIYVSGDAVLPVIEDIADPVLAVDYAQTSLRKIQSPEMGHFILRYLTAGELIGLANLQVESADLVIVATYASGASGPTPTPLPSPPPVSEEAP